VAGSHHDSKGGDSLTSPFGLMVGVGVPLCVYFVPSIVAVVRKVPKVGAVAVVNTFVGWTVIGWAVALYMATRHAEESTAARFSSEPASKASGWYPDPALRHEFRYFDGNTWTAHVADGGVTVTDPVAPPPRPRAVTALTQEELGSWGARAGGLLIDIGAVAAIGLVGVVVQKVIGNASFAVGFAVGLLAWLCAIAFWIGQLLRQGRSGQTFGQQIVGLKLVDSRSGGVVGGGTAVLRAVAHIVDSIACYVGGWLLPLWDHQRQTIADKIVGTVVIRVPKQPIDIRDRTGPRLT
jgi:uncharacterized RDD family membrane protein YckC